jgi:hypothetical protein
MRAGDKNLGCASCGKKEFPPPAPSLLSFSDGEKLSKAAIFYTGGNTYIFFGAQVVVFPHPAGKARPSDALMAIQLHGLTFLAN